MITEKDSSPEAEQRHHDYATNRIPWWVRAVWIGFWIFAIAYAVRYLIPAIQLELLERP
jgi:hypothetical protein